MLIDLNEDRDAAQHEADLCIVGAGAAGIVLAHGLLDTDLRVLLLESGGLGLEPETQALGKGEISGLPYRALHERRPRYFGGASNLWNGWCTTLEPVDFEARDWVARSGWPLRPADLEPYYRRAQPLCELGRYGYTAPAWPELALLPFEQFEHKFWQLSPPTRFGDVHRPDFARSQNVRVLLHANAVEIRMDPDARRVVAVDLANPAGLRTSVRARHFVVACGGIETPRLLLASRSVRECGVGNEHDQVGRYFADHPHLVLGFAPAGRLEASVMAAPPQIEGVRVRVGFGPTAEEQRARRLLNSAVTLEVHYGSPEFHAARELFQALRRAEWPAGGAEQMRAVGTRPGRVLADIAAKLWRGYGLPSGFRLGVRSESVPDPESRVRLGEKRDAVGVPCPVLHWQMGAQDKDSLLRTAELATVELGRLGYGPIEVAEWLRDGNAWPEDLAAGQHHLGTTRMSDDTKQGVVDRNGRVHGLSNLFVAGPSVFPTPGWANPTLTIAALALRLADHLKTLFDTPNS